VTSAPSNNGRTAVAAFEAIEPHPGRFWQFDPEGPVLRVRRWAPEPI
jgi:hypothetical protein